MSLAKIFQEEFHRLHTHEELADTAGDCVTTLCMVLAKINPRKRREVLRIIHDNIDLGAQAIAAIEKLQS
jgi:hypothetical protein